MNFCCNCGESVTQRTPENDNRLRFVCDHCETVHYQNPRVIVGVLPTLGEQILLCKRAIEPRHGYWTLPAGFLENGESTLEGAVRECKEETNASVVSPQLYAFFDIPWINQVYVFYRAELTDTSFGPTLESSEVKLFNEASIPWDELAFQVVGDTLKRFFSDRKTDQYAVFQGEISRT